MVPAWNTCSERNTCIHKDTQTYTNAYIHIISAPPQPTVDTPAILPQPLTASPPPQGCLQAQHRRFSAGWVWVPTQRTSTTRTGTRTLTRTSLPVPACIRQMSDQLGQNRLDWYGQLRLERCAVASPRRRACPRKHQLPQVGRQAEKTVRERGRRQDWKPLLHRRRFCVDPHTLDCRELHHRTALEWWSMQPSNVFAGRGQGAYRGLLFRCGRAMVEGWPVIGRGRILICTKFVFDVYIMTVVEHRLFVWCCNYHEQI